MTNFKDSLEEILEIILPRVGEIDGMTTELYEATMDKATQSIIELVDREKIEAQLQLLRNIDNSETRFNHGTIELLAAFKQQLNQQRQKLNNLFGKENK